MKSTPVTVIAHASDHCLLLVCSYSCSWQLVG